MTTSSTTTVSSTGTITPPPISGTADIIYTKRFYGPSMKQSGALAMAGAPRGAKTLGWFMNDADIFDKKKQSSSDESNEKSRFVASSVAIGDEVKRKQKRLRKTMSCQGAARKDGYAASQAMSESSEEGYEEKRVNSLLADMTITQAIQTPSTVENDEYWFYDVATDGYYYEQNGAKGWRRRMPNSAVHKMKQDQEVAHMNINGGGNGKMNTMLAAQAAAAQAAFLHQALLHQQQQQQPTMRYYDANSDGFYYEMASVDGWKRRQPNKPVSASVPAGITRPYAMRQADHQQTGMVLPPMAPSGSNSSYGAALARGQMPRNCVIDESSASSSICGDGMLQDLLGGYDSYPSISRPSNLKMEQQQNSQTQKSSQQINPNFNAERFIRDLSISAGVGGGSGSKFFGFQSPSNSSSWPQMRGCSVFNPSPIKSATALEDELNMNNLLKDLDKIWAAPTPGVNQA